ncbi:unnamed protein product [Rangifer tarandus platyrhynchus]|uniref:Uncharacterized protein n=1 Tax=Rangifer tarandus platyrhynchus TaxID=3082113 RepID=A0ABN8ZV42_RANTA|nr:unnamed protein product [Rangifer tarandus platyrhynchus]
MGSYEATKVPLSGAQQRNLLISFKQKKAALLPRKKSGPYRWAPASLGPTCGPHARPPPRLVPSRPGRRRGPCRAGRSGSCAAAARGGLAGGGERLCPSLCPIRECGLCPEPGSNA